MASIIDGLSYVEIMKMQIDGKLNFDELTETEICGLLDDAIDNFELENSDENECLINACLAALDRFPQYLPKLNDEKILNNILANQKKSPSLLRTRKTKTLIAIAATIALLFSITAVAYASGHNIFDLIFNRTSETLNIDVTNQNNSQVSSSSSDSELQELIEKDYDDLETFIAENPNVKLPAYIPDGMEFTYGQTVTFVGGEDYNVSFNNHATNESLSIGISVYSDEEFAQTFGIEIDNEYIEEYVVSEITHYIESNMGNFSATWFDGNESYFLDGNISVEEIKKIIESHYGG